MGLVPKDHIFENFFTRMKGEEENLFFEMAKKMICWLPEQRWTASSYLTIGACRSSLHLHGATMSAVKESDIANLNHATVSQYQEKRRKSDASALVEGTS